MVGLGILLLVYFGTAILFSRRLRQRHTPTWEELGSWDFFWNNRIRNSLLLLGFMLRRRYASLHDRKLTWLGDATFLLLFVWVAVYFVSPHGGIPGCNLSAGN